MKLAIHGAGGRMGRAVVRFALAQKLDVVGAVDQAGSAADGQDAGELAGVGTLGVQVGPNVSAALLGADLVIDFSTAAAFAPMLRAAMRAGVAVVSGTTRLGDEDLRLLDRAGERIAVLWAPNMSIGVQVLTRLVADAVRALGSGYDVEIVEAHHGAKADAPSGTAQQLAETVRKVRPELHDVHGREGQVGRRGTGELGVHALRGGGVVGDHSVHLLGPLERLEISHRAINRELFAVGALRAAEFLVEQPPGRYTLADVVDATGPAR